MVENLQHLYDFSFLLNASGLHLFLLESVSQSRKSHSQEDIWPVFSFVWFHPITSGYIHVVYSPKQFFSSMAVCVLHTGITNFPSHYHPFILSPFINQSLQPLYHLCCWSSLIPIQLVIISSAHGYPHLGLILCECSQNPIMVSFVSKLPQRLIQNLSPDMALNQIWSCVSSVFPLAVLLQSVFLHRHSGEAVCPKFHFSAWSFNICSFWDH